MQILTYHIFAFNQISVFMHIHYITHVFNLSAVDCGPLPVLINGSSYGSLTYFPNSIQFSCDSGFLLRGSSGRSCLPTGLWSGSNTTCEGQLLVKWSLFLHFLQFLSS